MRGYRDFLSSDMVVLNFLHTINDLSRVLLPSAESNINYNRVLHWTLDYVNSISWKPVRWCSYFPHPKDSFLRQRISTWKQEFYITFVITWLYDVNIHFLNIVREMLNSYCWVEIVFIVCKYSFKLNIYN